MLLLILFIVLVREFESRPWSDFDFILQQYKKGQQVLRAPSVGRHNSTRVNEGRKSSNLLAIKMQGTNGKVGSGG